jgi:hypothetical protein
MHAWAVLTGLSEVLRSILAVCRMPCLSAAAAAAGQDCLRVWLVAMGHTCPGRTRPCCQCRKARLSHYPPAQRCGCNQSLSLVGHTLVQHCRQSLHAKLKRRQQFLTVALAGCWSIPQTACTSKMLPGRGQWHNSIMVTPSIHLIAASIVVIRVVIPLLNSAAVSQQRCIMCQHCLCSTVHTPR